MATTRHEAHLSEYTLGQRVADWVAKVLGSWIEEILRRLERIEKRRVSRLAGAADVEPSDLKGA